MKVNQIATIMNNVTKEILGTEVVVNEDLSNIIDVGKQILGATDVDNYVKTLVNHIGKVVFVNRKYNGLAPKVLMDAWEYGSVLEKISGELPEVVENTTWGLTDGQTYSPDVFHAPKVSAKFFNDKVTFECDISFTERQVKDSFSTAEQLNAFISMIYNDVDKSMTIKTDALVMRTINNMIANTLDSDYKGTGEPSGYDFTKKSGVKAINLLKLYATETGTTITVDKAMTSPDFLRFATSKILLQKDRMARVSTLFNIGGKERFTPKEYLHTVLLSDFVTATNTYLQSDVFHKELVELPTHESVPYWQGSGNAYDFNSVSGIDVKSGKITVKTGGILGVMFDRDALGVANLDRRVQTHFNPKGEFYNNFYKFDAGYFNDFNENFVVFFIA